jgi:hypothetical protein
VHAVIHVIVENQIADDELSVRRTAQRLMSEGMRGAGSDSRLDQARSGQDPNKAYFAELERLTAKGWLRSGLSPRGAIGRM